MPKPAPRKPTKKKPARPPNRLAQLRRHEALKTLLRSGWKSLDEIVARSAASRASVFRDLAVIGEEEPLEKETIEGRNCYRLPARQELLRVTTAQMVSLAFALNAMSFLAGTGIKEDLDEIVTQIAHVLKKSDYAHWKNLDRKLFDVNEMAYDYSDKLDVVNDVVTALLREERVTCTMKDGRALKLDPYTLVLYKKGLYVLGHSHKHGEVRTFGLDKIEDAARVAGDRFEYPKGFHPAKHLRGPFGIIRGARENVKLRFDSRVAYFATRRRVHETQRHREVEGGVELEMEPEGTEEMVGWVLSFGGMAEAVEPKALRERVKGELRRALARYETLTPASSDPT
jgi:predicted DNA-binding transcriptional regulator YafY